MPGGAGVMGGRVGEVLPDGRGVAAEAVAGASLAGAEVPGPTEPPPALGGGDGSKMDVHVYVGREAFARYAVPSRRTPASPATHSMRTRLRSMKDPRPAAGRRERRVARLAELGRRGGVVKVSLVGWGTGSAWKSARSAPGA